jgi:hypothetical protein
MKEMSPLSLLLLLLAAAAAVAEAKPEAVPEAVPDAAPEAQNSMVDEYKYDDYPTDYGDYGQAGEDLYGKQPA